MNHDAARRERGASPRPTFRGGRGGRGARGARGARGFTLLEIGIAIVILSLLIAVAVPAMGALSGARLQEESRVLGGVIRDNYARTALAGKSTRLVVDMNENAWWVEDAPAVARLHREKLEADREGKVALDPVDSRIEDIEKDTRDEGERARLELLAPTQWVPADNDYGKPHKLNDDVRFKKMWVEHLDEAVAAGQVALYFFPGGFTEEAHITLTDDDEGERTLTLVVSSLTGEVAFENDEPRIPDLEDDG